MASGLKPIKVWGKGGPNPPKIYMVLEELGLPYEGVKISFPDLKQPDFLKINPNGRMPAIHDPNTGLTLWESGAIIEYLVERYDKDNKLSFPQGSDEAALAKQWLFFQVSGQGPYYGQAVFFKKFQPVPEAHERFVKELHRVTSVLEGWLAEKKKEAKAGSDGPWLVGDKYSYADLSFIPWQSLIAGIVGEEAFKPEDYPTVKEWLDKMQARPAIKAGWTQLEL